jgi:hypothetical protein
MHTGVAPDRETNFLIGRYTLALTYLLCGDEEGWFRPHSPEIWRAAPSDNYATSLSRKGDSKGMT